MLSRITVTVCVPMAGVLGDVCPRETRFLAISGILVFDLVSSWRRDYCGHFFIGTMVSVWAILQGVLIRRPCFPLYVVFNRS